MHGRRLATTEEVLAITTPDSDTALEQLDSWATAHDVDLSTYDVGATITTDDFSVARETIGVAIGGDGAFLEGVRQFAPHGIPLLGVNTGTLAFLARVQPHNLDDALTEVLRGRAAIHDRQQYRVEAGPIDTTGINEVFVRKHPPEERHRTKVGAVHVFVDEEYVGKYFGTGLIVSTPTGSTGRAFSNNGPVHYPHNNRTLQIIPHETINASANPLVVSQSSDIHIVPEADFDIDVDGGREFHTLDEDAVIHVTGADQPARVIRTLHDDPFINALVDKLGWRLRTLEDEGPRERLPTASSTPDFLTQATRVAREAARSAGEPLRELHGQVEQVEYKTDKADIVTEADYQAEHIITTAIQTEFPQHSILSEEDVTRSADGEYTWLVDPLDGTGNFAHGNPNYAISIALLDGDDVPRAGVIYNPETEEMFHAIDGKGAFQNGGRIEPTDRDRLDESMLLSGYDPDGSFLRAFYNETQGVRRLGSAALHLAYIAAGSADAVWEYDTYPWDVAAGLVLLREAGGRLTDDRGEPYTLEIEDGDSQRTPLLASNDALHTALLDHLRTARL
ncbi:MAG: inositol monophosphatase family protein [Halobacteriaceae archaeon]